MLALALAGLPGRVSDVFATVAATLATSATPEIAVSATRRRMSVIAGSTFGAVEDEATRAVELSHAAFAARCLGAEAGGSHETVWVERRVSSAGEAAAAAGAAAVAAAGKRAGALLLAWCVHMRARACAVGHSWCPRCRVRAAQWRRCGRGGARGTRRLRRRCARAARGTRRAPPTCCGTLRPRQPHFPRWRLLLVATRRAFRCAGCCPSRRVSCSCCCLPVMLQYVFEYIF
jgi:hypothetical protein